jgi:hypothetical protein
MTKAEQIWIAKIDVHLSEASVNWRPTGGAGRTSDPSRVEAPGRAQPASHKTELRDAWCGAN